MAIITPRKTKIIATMGPACRSKDTLTQLFKNGVNIIRLNFSHGSHEEHAENIKMVREVADSLGIQPGILLDLQGPKIRTGEIENDGIKLIPGETITFTPEKIIGTNNRVSISYENLCNDIKPGDKILLDDGLMDVTVIEKKEKDVVCKINTGGLLKAKKGVNLPGADLSISPITRKDKEDLQFGLKNGIDFVALSFVRTSQEVLELKGLMKALGREVPLISKIEKGEAVKNIDAIIDATDAIMVARGDLGVETAPEEVPLTQKMIIEKCSIAGKPVIIATQMLDSMIQNPRPTRAEATDVANAVFDGADAIMLSGETAAGKYPLDAVKMMDRIARSTERVAYRKGHFKKDVNYELLSIPDAMAHAIANLAENIYAKYIIAFTFSGATAKLLSKYRTSVPIIAMTHNREAIRQLSLYWGIESIPVERARSIDEIMEIARVTLLLNNLIEPGENAVISTGVPLGKAGTTNMLRVMQIPHQD